MQGYCNKTRAMNAAIDLMNYAFHNTNHRRKNNYYTFTEQLWKNT